MSDYFPSDRQSSLYNIIEYEERVYHQATNASAQFFRVNYQLISYGYLILFAISVLEWGSAVMGSRLSDGLQFAGLANSTLVTIMAIVFSMSHHYIYLIYGHGYKQQSAQFYVDKYSSLVECKQSMGLMRNFYMFSIFTAVLTLIISWITAKNSLTEQYNSLINFFEVTYSTAALSKYGVSNVDEYADTLIAYNWITTLMLLAIIIIGLVGVIQTKLAKVDL